MKHLIVGHGQLGSAVCSHLPVSDVVVAEVPWADPALAREALSAQVRHFLATDSPRSVLWCAGAGFVGAAPQRLQEELDVFRSALYDVDRCRRGPTRVFVAGSAGGVHGGNRDLCDEHTEPVAASDYGRSKLAQEQIASQWARSNDAEVLIGRISNLFGPRQNLRKPQGFISHLLVAMMKQRPVVFTVSGTTLRDFVYADDVGRWVASWAARPHGETGPLLKILASERSMSLLNVTAIAARITRRSPRALFARSTGAQHPTAIRFASRVEVPSLGRLTSRPIEHGLWLTWSALVGRRTTNR